MIARRSLALSLLVGLAMTLGAACGDDDDDGGDASESAEGDNDAADDDDPGAIDISAIEELEDGTLSVLISAPYPPFEDFGPGGETDIVGFTPDLAAAMGEKLGVEVEMIQTSFDGILDQLIAGDGDAVISTMYITPERDEQVDFVPYLSVGTGIGVAAGNPEGVAALEDLCGLAVAVQDATTHMQELQLLNADQCADDQVEVVVHDDHRLVVEELADGDVDAILADFPTVLDAAATFPEDIEATDYHEALMPKGIAYVTDSPLGEALQAAFDAVVADGTYQALLAEYGIEDTALAE